MVKKKIKVKVRDLKPRKDAKGGGFTPTGASPTGSNPTGSNPTGSNPTGTNPTGTIKLPD
jgi:hypothetical protein